MKPPPLYAIIDPAVSTRPLELVMSEFAAAGVTWVQLRDKQANSREFFDLAQLFVKLARRHGLIAIINDRADLAWLCGADGVHLGQQDLPVEQARKILGPHKVIGFSTHQLAQAIEAERSSADYVAIGPVFATTTKKNPDPVVEVEELKEIRRQVSKPLVAIGGITSNNAAGLFALGIDSVAVIRDVLCTPDIRAKVAEFLNPSRRS